MAKEIIRVRFESNAKAIIHFLFRTNGNYSYVHTFEPKTSEYGFPEHVISVCDDCDSPELLRERAEVFNEGYGIGFADGFEENTDEYEEND